MSDPTHRTGEIGNCVEYDADGNRLAGDDRETIEEVIALSMEWPETYHRYVNDRGYSMWAHAGAEISENELPEALRRAVQLTAEQSSDNQRAEQ